MGHQSSCGGSLEEAHCRYPFLPAGAVEHHRRRLSPYAPHHRCIDTASFEPYLGFVHFLIATSNSWTSLITMSEFAGTVSSVFGACDVILRAPKTNIPCVAAEVNLWRQPQQPGKLTSILRAWHHYLDQHAPIVVILLHYREYVSDLSAEIQKRKDGLRLLSPLASQG